MAHRYANLTNRRFGRLKVLWMTSKSKWKVGTNGRPMASWVCRCDCGEFPVVVTSRSLLASKGRRSCGCGGGLAAEGVRGRMRKYCRMCGKLFYGIVSSRFCSVACRDKCFRPPNPLRLFRCKWCDKRSSSTHLRAEFCCSDHKTTWWKAEKAKELKRLKFAIQIGQLSETLEASNL